MIIFTSLTSINYGVYNYQAKYREGRLTEKVNCDKLVINVANFQLTLF